MTETEIFESVMGSGATDFATLVGILNQHGSWCLIGGLAVNCYVEPVYTIDADLVVVASELQSIKVALINAGFTVEEFPHSVNARMKDSKLRIQLSIDPRYQEFLTTTTVCEVLDQKVPVASLSNIVRGKIWAWSDDRRRLSKRKKDELDLIRILEGYPEFRDVMPPEISGQLEQE